MTSRGLLLVGLMLTLTTNVWAGVVSHPEDFRGDPAAPPPKWLVQARHQKAAGTAQNGDVTDDQQATPVPQTQPSAVANGSVASATAGRRVRREAAHGPAAAPASVPGGRSTWPLIAIAVLLLVFAGGGGYYFYSRRDE